MDVNEAAFARHLEAFRKGDVDTLVAGYAPNAVMLNMEGVITGLDKIRETFEMIFAKVVPPGTADISMKQQLIQGPYAYIFWSATSPDRNVPIGSDSFVFDDGKIVAHTFAAQIVPPLTP